MIRLQREDLQEIRERAEENAENTSSKLWARAYLNLADAANCLDAMIARTEVTLPQETICE